MTALLSVTASVYAWTPDKTIEIVVPYPAGGATDQIGRIVSEIFTKQGWNNIVVNKPGASTTIGTNYVAEAKADGTTLYIVSNGALDANLVFDDGSLGIKYTEHSFTDITKLTNGAFVLVASKDAPYNTYEEFKQYIRKNPNEFNIGFWNLYTSNILYDLAKKENLPKPNVILYKGSAPQIQDLLGNHLKISLDAYTTVAPHYAAGNVKILAVLDNHGYSLVKRSFPKANITNITSLYPTINLPIYIGLQGPAGMDPAVVKEMNRVINEEFKKPEYASKMSALYIDANPGKPEEFTRVHRGILNMFKNIKNDTK